MSLAVQHADALQHYQTFGFAHFKQVIPATITTDIRQFLLNEFIKLDQHCEQQHGISLQNADKLAATYQGKLDQVSQDDRFLFSGVFPTQVRLDAQVEQILHCQPLIDLGKQILDCRTVFAHLPVMSRYIIPHNHMSAVPPHRDDQYNSHLSNFITVWIPLVDIDDDCGGVNFFPQSVEQRQATDRVLISDANFWQEPIAVEQLACEMPHLSVGDVLIFDPDVIHGSAANTSSHIRYSLDIRLFSERDTTSKFSLNLATGERISPVEK